MRTGLAEVMQAKTAKRKQVEDAVNKAQSGVDGLSVEDNKREHIIGIDLGTTYSCVAVWRNGEAEVLQNTGAKPTPNPHPGWPSLTAVPVWDHLWPRGYLLSTSYGPPF